MGITLQAFSRNEFETAGKLLAAKVATMLGRKMEEADWDFVYCNAKKIPTTGWSNLNIDIVNNGLGVEHKMYCFRKKTSVKEACGTTLMHPSATRSIRINGIKRDPNQAAKDVLEQYVDLIRARTAKVAESSNEGKADIRFGWLIWKEMLDEFLYFEEPMSPPKPEEYYAEWNETPARGTRKATRSLWIYEKETNKKRYSVTTDAGAKIQPYFDVPSPSDKNLYYFKVQGRILDGGLVEVWLTNTTAKYISAILGGLDSDELSKKILETSPNALDKLDCEFSKPSDIAIPIKIKIEAYEHLKSTFEYVSDEYIFQQFALSLTGAFPVFVT